MSEATGDSTLVSFVHAWGKYQDGLVRAIEPLTAGQLGLRIAPELRTIGQLATHIVNTRAGWMTGALGVGVGTLDDIAQWTEPDAPVKSAAELCAAFGATWDALRGFLERATPAELDGEVTPTRNGRTYTFIRRGIIWHLLEHDLHHGGELSFSLGAHGLPAPRL